MRVAIFTETFLPKTDGVVTILCGILDALIAAGIDVIVYAPPGAPSAYRSIPVYPSWGPRFPLYPELFCSMPTAAGIRAIRVFNPDVIHVLNPTFIGAVGTIMAVIGRVPLIASVHMDIIFYVKQYAGNWGLPIAWTFFRIWHNRARINLAPSRAMVNQLATHGIKRTMQWQRGVDLTRFRRLPVDTALRLHFRGENPDAIVLLYVGRLTPEKGIDALLPLAQDPRYRLVLVGGGQHEVASRARFAHTNALFTGVITGPDVVAAYNAADIFVFPSQSESFGLAPLEAMACGLAVVAPFVGGLQETIQPERNAVSYDPASPDGLGAAVARLASNPALRMRIAAAGHAYAQTRSHHAAMEQIISIYRSHADGR